MKTFKFTITTPERTLLSEEIEQVSLPTEMGEITILPHHIPLVSLLRPGEMRVIRNGKEELYAVAGGFIEVSEQGVTVLADAAEHADEIDEAKAEEARKRAEEVMSKEVESEERYIAAQLDLQKHMARLRVARKRKKR
ncbi:MAG: F0F1 ATP synthase subunit epsilon [Patescibacteria group bacterium]|jgi:F-type H+-transporting ATPase subunit epsilon